MLNYETVKEILALVNQSETILKNYHPSFPDYKIEATLTFFEIKSLLLDPPPNIDPQLTQILLNRWERIQNTNCQYLHDFTNPANTLCIAIALELSAANDKNFLCLLMPTLKETPEDAYISSSYMDIDDDANFQEMLLSDCNTRLINISDVLNLAGEDGVLKHNSLFGNQAEMLSVTEIHRLLSRHPAIQAAFDSISARVLYKLEGDTVGAELDRLIHGLRQGGEKRGLDGTELKSGRDANTAIVAFSEYLATLDAETTKQLMSAAKTDRNNSNIVETQTVATYWKRLAEPDQGINQETIYCVDLIAGKLEEILEENEHLYDLVSYQGAALNNIIQLNEAVAQTKRVMEEKFLTIKTHPSYPDSKENLSPLLLTAIKKAELPLGVEELKFIIQMHSEDPTNLEQKSKIRSIFKNNPCPANECQKLTKEEQEVYFTLNPAPKKSTVAANPSSLFNESKKRRHVEPNIAPEDDENPHAKQAKTSHRSMNESLANGLIRS